MIRKFIDRLLGKGPAADDGLPAGVTLGQRVEYGVDQHKIDPRLIIEPAVNVCKKLKDAGYEAYIVGGAVRDLLVNLEPKDFDVATNATPEQVKALFRRAFIVGRRFRLVHVIYGRGREHEKIEVSTFRAYLDNAADASAVQGNEKTSRSELEGKSHAVDASGRVLRDNVWGPQNEDAARRDITVNAMYYDPATQVVVDYHGGMVDSKAKLLQTGHSLQSIAMLKKYGLDRGVFAILDSYFEGIANNPAREAFVNRALADTDRRVSEGKPVAPSFLMACVFWHEVSARWQALREQGEGVMPALQAAVDATFDARIGDISGRGKLAADMREIWQMQPRFDKRTGSSPAAMLAQPRFRAAFDFMRLRADAGEIDMALVEWWEAYSMGDEDKRRDLLEAARKQAQSRPREPKAAPRAPRPLKAAAPAPDVEPAPAPAPRVSAAKQQMLQLAATARTALADGATDADRAAMRALFDNTELPFGTVGPDAPPLTATQELLREFADLMLVAIGDDATDADIAGARSLLDKVEKKANTTRRRRGGGGRRKAAAGPAFKDDEDDDGDAEADPAE